MASHQGRPCSPVGIYATYAEFRDKLGDPRFGISPASRDSILAEYLHYAEYIRDAPDSGNAVPQDESDNPFVDLAMAKKADAIVSVDTDLLNCNGMWDFPVITIAELVQRFA